MEQQKTIQQQGEVDEMQHGPVPVDQLQASGIASIDVKAPLRKFVKKIKKYKGGGSWEWQCTFCKSTYYGPHTRVKIHLLHGGKGIAKCTEISTEAQTEISELVRICKERERTSRVGQEEAASSSSRTTRSSHVESNEDLLKMYIEENERLSRDYAQSRKTCEAYSKENGLLHKLVCQQRKKIQKLQREEDVGREDNEDVEGDDGEGTS